MKSNKGTKGMLKRSILGAAAAIFLSTSASTAGEITIGMAPVSNTHLTLPTTPYV